MTKQAAKIGKRKESYCWDSGALFLLFFVPALFVYTWLRLDPAAEHHFVGPFFYFGSPFLGTFYGRAGGLVEYAACFLGHLSQMSWLGALIFSVLGMLMFMTARWLLRRVSGITSIVPSVAMVFLLLLLRNRQGSPGLTVGLAFLLVTVFVAFWAACARLRLGSRIAIAAVLPAVLFYVAGLYSCLLVALMVGLYEFRRAGNWKLGIALAAIGISPCALSLFIIPNVYPAFFNAWPSRFTMLLEAVLPFFVFMIACAGLLAERAVSVAPAGKVSKSSSPRFAASWQQGSTRHRFLLAAVVAVGVILTWFTFDERAAALAKIEYFAGKRDYAGVMAVASGMQALDVNSAVRLHSALYHCGVLSSKLFAYAYPPTPEILPGAPGGLASWRAQAQTMLELGLVSDAEHLAHEALECDGNRPDVLRTLSEVNVLKGRPKAARVFLNVLRRVPFERSWAEARLREIEADPQLGNDAEVKRIRSCLLTNDLPHSRFPSDPMLAALLQANPRNQMALEYLLATRLAGLDLAGLAESLPLLDGPGNHSLPRHLEEALLLHQHLSGSNVDLRGHVISAGSRQNFERFLAALGHLPDHSLGNLRSLRSAFGDTYWLYFFSKEAESKAARSSAP